MNCYINHVKKIALEILYRTSFVASSLLIETLTCAGLVIFDGVNRYMSSVTYVGPIFVRHIGTWVFECNGYPIVVA